MFLIDRPPGTALVELEVPLPLIFMYEVVFVGGLKFVTENHVPVLNEEAFTCVARFKRVSLLATVVAVICSRAKVTVHP
jgi:hypothetical protein